jgi:ABC-2 type transport system permease protein
MSKITTIIQREYITRVRKKSFIIMTLAAPLLFAAMTLLPALIMSNNDKDFKKIAVVEDGSDLFIDVIPNRSDVEFEYLGDVDVNQLKSTYDEAGYYGVLYISPVVVNVPNAVQLISSKQPPLDLLQHIERALEKKIETDKLAQYNIEDLDQILKSVKSNVSIQTVKINDEGEIKETSTGLAMGLAYGGAFLMYMIVLLFGVQVMRGVFEEKNNRIVEVIISSVKPFELMMGKILGIALVGLTQFIVWIVLTGGIVMVAKSVLIPSDAMEISQSMTQSIMDQTQISGGEDMAAALDPKTAEIAKVLNSFMNVPWGLILVSFFLYFIFGYLLYASIFAAVGSAVDSESDTQQFMFPIMLPIIIGLFVAMGTMENPESSLSFWFSMIPFTSPIVMMARIPFEVPIWEVALSLIILASTFVGMVYLSARIYRVGILMYGKKVSYKEMWKWIRYKA